MVSNHYDPCSNSHISLDIAAFQGNSCTDDYEYRVGLLSNSTNLSDTIKHLAFDLVFDLDPGDTLASADFTNWAAGSLHGCLSGGACYQISGDTFRYCFTYNSRVIFPVDTILDHYIKILFSHTSNGCVKGVKITKLEVENLNGICIPPIKNPVAPQTQSIALSICGPKVHGILATEQGNPLLGGTLTAAGTTSCGATCSGSCTSDTATSAPNGYYGFCNLCSSCTHFKITPYDNSNPLNGVTTYDLVLISKNILGIQPLGSPYKLIAADANKMNGVTTADIVEFRKLILGIYTALPSNTSWRFVASNYTFPNPINPFSSAFPESIDCIDPAVDSSRNFVAIKIGDVNNSAIANTNNRPAARPVVTLGWNKAEAKSGGTITLPVIYTGNESLEAIQLGIHFDPSKLSLIGPSKGDLDDFNADNFGLTQVSKGDIRTLWLSPINNWQEKIKPGATLFNLTFQARTSLAESESIINFDDQILENIAWQPDGTEYSIVGAPINEQNHAGAGIPSSLKVSIRPNPTSGMVVFNITSEKATEGKILLLGAYGNGILERKIMLEPGQQEITIPDVKDLPAGVYLWKVYGGNDQAQGHLIKQ